MRVDTILLTLADDASDKQREAFREIRQGWGHGSKPPIVTGWSCDMRGHPVWWRLNWAADAPQCPECARPQRWMLDGGVAIVLASDGKPSPAGCLAVAGIQSARVLWEDVRGVLNDDPDAYRDLWMKQRAPGCRLVFLRDGVQLDERRTAREDVL